MEITKTIIVVCAVFDLGLFEHLIEETEFSYENLLLKVFK